MPAVNSALYLSRTKYSSRLPTTGPNAGIPVIQPTYTTLPTGQVVQVVANVPVSAPVDVPAPPILSYISGVDTQTFSPSVGASSYNLYDNNDALLLSLGSATSFTLSSLQNANSSYTVYVTASNSGGTSAPSNSITFITNASPPIISLAGSNLNLRSTNTGSITYKLYGIGAFFTTISSGNASLASLGLTPGTVYTVSATATGLSGFESLRSSTLQICIPIAPSGLTAGTPTTTGATLTWVAPTGGVTGYNVYEGANLLTSTTSTTFSASALNPSTSYSLSVKSYYNSINNESATSASVSFITVPTDPTNASGTLSLVDPTTGTLNWNLPAFPSGTPTGYIISKAGVVVATVSALTYAVTGLSLGVSNTFTIRSYYNNTSNLSTPGATATVLTPPGPPVLLTAPSKTTTGATLSWVPPTGGVTGYNIYNGVTKIGNTSSTSFTASGLNPSTSYTLSVKTYLTLPTNESTAVNVSFNTVPTDPTNASGTLSLVDPTTGTLNWNLPAFPSGTPTGYIISKEGTLVATVSALTYAVSGLTLGATNTFTIRSFFNGISNVSEPGITATVLTPPDRPRLLSALTPSTTGATLSWLAPIGNATGYNIYNGVTKIGTTTSTTFPVSGLIPSTSYTLSVKTYLTSTTNESIASNVTFDTVPTDPTNASGTLSLVNPTTGTLNWNLPASPSGTPTGYIISKEGAVVATVSALTYAVTGLILGQTNTYTIRSYFNSTSNLSTPGASATFLTPPNPPTSLTAPTKTTTGATLSWVAPTGGVTGYNIYNGVTKIGNTGTTSFTASGLNPSTSYTLSVKTYLTSTTNESTAVNVTFDTVPTDPTNASGTLSLVDPTSGTLNWNAPAFPSGTPTGYIISKEGTLVATVSALTYAVTGLSLGATNTFTIASYFNSTSNLSTPGASATFTTPPAPPVSLTISNMPSTTATLNWIAPAGRSTGYNIYNGTILLGTTTSISFPLTGLVNATSYTLSVKTFFNTNTNESSPSNITFDTIPLDPTALTISQPTNNSLQIGWNNAPNATGYTIFNGTTALATVVGATSYTATGLNPATFYSFTVKTYFRSSTNLSTPGAQITGSTLPNSPISLQAINVTQTTATLSWTPPAGSVSSYKIYDSGNNLLATTSSTTYNLGTPTPLTLGTSYTYGVSSFNNSTSTESTKSTVTFSTIASLNPPTNLVIQSTDNVQVALNWLAPVGPHDGYVIVQSGYATTTYNYADSTNTPAPYTVTGLVPGQAYTFNIFTYAGTTTNRSSTSATVSVITRPSPPTGLSSSQTTVLRTLLTWNPATTPTGVNGLVYKYNVYYGTNFLGSVSASTSPLSYVVTGLIRNSTYVFNVSAVAKSATIPDIETVATGTVSLATVTVTTPLNWSQILYQPTSNIYTWKGVAMSTGADRIYAIADNAPYFSLDYGATWNIDSAIVNAGGSYFSGVSMAADGLKVAIACQNGGVYVCNDITQGVKTWIQIQNLSGAPTFWRSVALSGDGTKLYAGLCDESQNNFDSVCYSSYNGSSWAPFQRLGPNTSANKARWVDLACNNNGSIVFAATGQGTYFYKFTIGVSTNWGQFQSSQAGQQYTVTSVCCNTDGTRAYYSTQSGGLYYMFGTNNQVDQFGDFGKTRQFTSVRCTPDGQGVIAVDKANGGQIVRWVNGTGGNGTVLLTDASMSGSNTAVAVNAASNRIIAAPPRVGDNDPNLQTRKIWIGDYT